MQLAACEPVALFRDTPEFLERFRAGSRDAMETVYCAYVGRVERWVRRGFHSRRGAQFPGVRLADLEDLVQEIFVRAFSVKARLSFDGMRDYGPFLYTITKNLVIDWSRKQGREVPIDGREAEFATETAVPKEEPPWTDPETERIVETFVQNLPKELVAVHRERYVLGRTQRAAAAELGLTRQQLRTRENRLRKGLDAALRQGKTKPTCAVSPGSMRTFTEKARPDGGAHSMRCWPAESTKSTTGD
jgi:RNA polymerase sigma-70 factor, ECF subfamily